MSSKRLTNVTFSFSSCIAATSIELLFQHSDLVPCHAGCFGTLAGTCFGAFFLALPFSIARVLQYTPYDVTPLTTLTTALQRRRYKSSWLPSGGDNWIPGEFPRFGTVLARRRCTKAWGSWSLWKRMWGDGQLVWVVDSHATVNEWWERHVDTKHGYEQYFGYVRYRIKISNQRHGCYA